MSFEDMIASEHTFPNGVAVLVGRWPDVLGGRVLCGKTCKYLEPPISGVEPMFHCGLYFEEVPTDAVVNGECFEAVREELFLTEDKEGEKNG